MRPSDHCLRIAIVPAAARDEQVVSDLASGLVRRGHRVRLYSAEAGYERLFRRLRADGADVVNSHAGDARAMELAAGFPLLQTLRMPPGVDRLLRALGASSAALAAVSECVARQWRHTLGRDVQVIRDGVPDFTPISSLPQPVALVAGRIEREHRIPVAIRAALASGLSVDIAGEFADAACFEREVAPLLGARVRLHACLSRRDLWQRMAASAVCLATSDIAVAEAQIAGCPVVGYARGALAEIVEEDVSGLLVPPGDGAALTIALRRALALDRRAVRASARARLLIEPMLDRYESELTALAERSRPPRAQVIPHPALTSF